MPLLEGGLHSMHPFVEEASRNALDVSAGRQVHQVERTQWPGEGLAYSQLLETHSSQCDND
jgi:hypothetical protein